ncbi:SixA phosphatase family protein [Methylobacterium sp. R2-1]|uniref:SixA phosphatase family protein n=1 Tax=Methylobacterium sp. R2-1 TaxID=2587064 RepID=UPI0016139383|nr:histidine phosphatase family protein [Methylobacterium sp. R2-1]MBB2962976.1 phosphohistidine phosphatase [Methylobacterium sp. R2-1]
MRRLLLLRHAKSAYPQGVGDIDRPLNPRGREAAPLMGAYIAREALTPDHVMVSPARRTQETWEGARAELPETPMETIPSIYEAPAGRILDVIRTAPAEAKSLLVIGHNPGLGDLALRLVGEGPKELQKDLREKFPTAALAVLEFDAEGWEDIATGAGRLLRFVRPRQLAADMDDD